MRATAFTRPNPPELAHDWLWRHVVALPERGRTAVAQILVRGLQRMDPRLPEPGEEARRTAAEAAKLLQEEGVDT